MSKITKILEISTRILLLFSSFMVYIGAMWFANQQSEFENSIILLLAIITLFLAGVSYKLINKNIYILICLSGLVLFIYINLIKNPILSIGYQGVLFILIQIFAFILLIYISMRHKNSKDINN
ncbi:hypothetical protein [Sulfurimonas sp.]|uniref:hypothetical protein n=1 Tax=Sulfurimonas sp. TaxID=2022749 RepID=UPI002AB260D5|nr:hypothetical protein [Sulfurimonas sp.]